MLEVAEDRYDFSPIDDAIAALDAIDQGLNLALFPASVPQYVLDEPGVQLYTHFTFGLTAVPWDAYAPARWDALCEALANHLVPSKAQGGAMVPLYKHPTLKMLSASIVWLNSYRVVPDAQTILPGYTRDIFTDGTVASIHSIRDRFASKYAFVGIWPIKDATSSPSHWEHVLARLPLEFDGVDAPLLGLFQENLAASEIPTTNVVSGSPTP